MKKIISLVLMQMVMIAVLAATQPASVSAREMELTVGPGQEYETIQAAVNDALPGSKILVYSRSGETTAEYEESVRIRTNNLQIIAQGIGVIVDPPPGNFPGFDVNADHVTVRGFEISGADVVGITFQGSHNTFAENIIHLFQGPGPVAIQCVDDDGGSDYNTIESNNLSGWGSIPAGTNYGIYVSASSDALNEGNVIKNNTIVDMDSGGIYVSNGTGFQISGNILDNIFVGDCILVEANNNESQGHHRILKNTLSRCAKAGISLYASPGTVLAHNHISENEIGQNGNGVYLFADQDAAVNDNLIRGNLVYGNWIDGISLSAGSDHNRILNNEVQTNREVGVAVAGDNNLIVGNWIWDNIKGLDDTGEGNRWRNNTVSDF